MRIQRPVVLGAMMLAIVLGGLLSISHVAHHQHAQHGVYYCPMHPHYTSDHPGNCPICSMKLVKADSSNQQSAISSQQNSKKLESICYLHNCPKLHEGKPCPMTVLAKPGEKVTCPICGMHIAEAATPPTERKIVYWTDPMIPGYRSDKPGKSPMGMDLVPVYEETTGISGISSANLPAGYAPVLLTPEKQQLIGVTTAPVQKRSVTKTIRAAGVIAHDPELYQAQQEFIQAQQAWQDAQAKHVPEATAQARQLVDSSRLRLRHLGLSEELINDISTWTQPDHRLLLGGAGEYWVYASIYEYELSLVHPEQTVAVEVGAYPGRPFTGIIKAIDPMLDPMTRTARARVIVQDPEGVLKPEMYVTVSIAVDLGNILAVPNEAVFSTGEQHIVFVDKGQGLFEPHRVIVGSKADTLWEIKEGLQEGDRVVTSGNFLIDSESRLRGALQGSDSHQHGQ